MANVPDIVELKFAKKLQELIRTLGVILVLISLAAFNAGNPGGGIVIGALALVTFFVASKIKTRKHLRGGQLYYE